MSRRGRTQERRACAALLTAALAFVAVQQFGGWLLLRVWPEVRFVGLGQVRRNAAEHRHEPVIAFFGSSRFGNGVLPEVMEAEWRKDGGAAPGRALNFAAPACDLAAVEFIRARLERDGMRPKAIVVEVGPELLAARGEWLNFRVVRQLGWTDGLGAVGELQAKGLLRTYLMGQTLPLWKHRQAIRHEALRALLPEVPERHPGLLAGNQAKVEDWLRRHREEQQDSLDLRVERGLAPLRKWLQAGPCRVGGANQAAFERLLAASRESDVPLFLVRMPVTARHRALFSPEAERDYEAVLAEAGRRNPRLIRIDAPSRFPDELFMDNHHLNAVGGERFSRWLAGELTRRSADFADSD